VIVLLVKKWMNWHKDLFSSQILFRNLIAVRILVCFVIMTTNSGILVTIYPKFYTKEKEIKKEKAVVFYELEGNNQGRRTHTHAHTNTNTHL
jgi:hypothetical protein